MWPVLNSKNRPSDRLRAGQEQKQGRWRKGGRGKCVQVCLERMYRFQTQNYEHQEPKQLSQLILAQSRCFIPITMLRCNL